MYPACWQTPQGMPLPGIDQRSAIITRSIHPEDQD